MEGHAGMHGALTPTMPGEDAFGAIQEVVRILDADPKTDWSKVDLEALRQHLIDMNEVTLKADADAKTVDGGLEIAITGIGRTLIAIQRMIPAYAQHANGLNPDREGGFAAEWRAANRYGNRPKGNPAYSRARLYRPARERFDASAAPSGDGEGRVRPRPFAPGSLKNR
jgi:hypothetical protein